MINEGRRWFTGIPSALSGAHARARAVILVLQSISKEAGTSASHSSNENKEQTRILLENKQAHFHDLPLTSQRGANYWRISTSPVSQWTQPRSRR